MEVRQPCCCSTGWEAPFPIKDMVAEGFPLSPLISSEQWLLYYPWEASVLQKKKKKKKRLQLRGSDGEMKREGAVHSSPLPLPVLRQTPILPASMFDVTQRGTNQCTWTYSCLSPSSSPFHGPLYISPATTFSRVYNVLPGGEGGREGESVSGFQRWLDKRSSDALRPFPLA